MNYVQALPRARRRRRHWPSDRQIFLALYVLFVLDQVGWIVHNIMTRGEWVQLPFLLIWGFLYRIQIGLYERAKEFEERYHMPYPPLPRFVWPLLAVLYVLAVVEWTPLFS